jgi:RNA polymerase sigma-70 factor (ECF subfamily)
MEVFSLKMSEDMTKEKGEADESPLTLQEIFESMEGPLLAYVYHLMNDRDEAQDIVQESFLRLHQHFDEVRQPSAWLYRTSRNLAFSYKRKHGKVVPFSPIVGEDDSPSMEQIDEQPLPDDRTEHLESVGLAMLCLDRLAEDMRTLVKMKFVEGLSYKEMAATTGMSIGNVGYKLHHAIKLLAGEMEREGALA